MLTPLYEYLKTSFESNFSFCASLPTIKLNAGVRKLRKRVSKANLRQKRTDLSLAGFFAVACELHVLLRRTPNSCYRMAGLSPKG